MRSVRTSLQGFTKGNASKFKSTCTTFPIFDYSFGFKFHNINIHSPDSSQKCGPKLLKRWPFPGGQQKQCTGNLAKQTWHGAPVWYLSLSPTSPWTHLPPTTAPHLLEATHTASRSRASCQTPAHALADLPHLVRTTITTTVYRTARRTAAAARRVPLRPDARVRRARCHLRVRAMGWRWQLLAVGWGWG